MIPSLETTPDEGGPIHPLGDDELLQGLHRHMMTHHFCWFMGVPMSQHPWTVPTFDLFFKRLEAENQRVSRIVELGTGSGGLTIWLGLYALFNEIKMVSYDVTDNREFPPVFDRLQIDYRLRSILLPEVQEEIQKEISSPGITLLLCDNGDKVAEVLTFGPYLKVGDFLFAHDYALDPDHQAYMTSAVWPQCEILETQIQELGGFEPYMQPQFLRVAWMSKRRVSR